MAEFDVTAKTATDLIESAAEWIGDAIAAWLDNDPRRVVSLAPLALEHLGKAALWRRSPTLVAPLDRNYEDTLVTLAMNPAASDLPRIRTVGLSEVLSRLAKVRGDRPITKERVRVLVNCRNGALHLAVVQHQLARAVLADTLTLLNWLLEDVGQTPEEFYGHRTSAVLNLLDTRRTEIERHVAEKRHRAREKYDALVASIPDTGVLAETIRSLSAVARSASESLALPVYTVAQDCPVCGSEAALVGALDIDAEVDAEYEDGGITYYGGWVVRFQPETFHCGVCQLRFYGPQELAVADLGETRELGANELDFDVNDYMVEQAGDYADYADYRDDDYEGLP